MSADAFHRDRDFAELLAENVEALREEIRADGLEDSVVDPDLELGRATECLKLLERLRIQGSPAEQRSTPAGWTTGGIGPAPIAPLQELGRFRIVRELGRGGLGVVYLADDPQVRRQVALKIPRPEALASDELRRRFVREAEAAARLSHLHLVPVYEAGEVRSICYIASEYCPGPTLGEWLRGFLNGIGIDEAARITMQLALAVQHAHGRGVLHRDIKPGNVLLGTTADGPAGHADAIVPKLTDFGMAKLLEGETGETRSGALVGTPAYMAPEQAQGRVADLDARTDVYALGAILYELLTGRRPHAGESDVEVLHAVLFDEPVAPRRIRPAIPRDLEAITLRCLAKRSDERYATAQQLADDLARFRAGELTEARPLGASGRIWKWVRRNPVVAALAACIVVALLGGIGASTLFAVRSQSNAELALENAALADQRAAEARASAAESLRQKEFAEQQRQSAREMLYAANMQLVRPAWERADAARVEELLRQAEPQAGESDVRGWEWYYWRRQCRSELRTLEGHQGWVRGAAFHPDGRRVASVSMGGLLRIWDLVTGDGALDVQEKDGGFFNVAYSPDGRLLAVSGENGAIKLRDSTSGAEIRSVPGSTSYPQTLTFSPNGRLLATTNNDGIARIIDVPTGEVRHSLVAQVGSGVVTGVAFSADSRRLATSAADKSVRIWDVESGKRQHELPVQPEVVRALAFSPDGRWLVTGGNSLTLWDAEQYTVIEELAVPPERITCLAFSLDSRRLVVSGEGRAVHLWDTQRRRLLRSYVGHTSAVNGVAFSPDGAMIASASDDKTVKLWDADDSAEFRSFAGQARSCYEASFSPDGRTIATAGSDGAITIRNAETGQPLLLLVGHTKLVRSLEFSPDGGRLVSASNDGSTRVWDANTGQMLRLLLGTVSSARFSQDGRRLIGTCGRIVKLWNATTGEETAEVVTAESGVDAVFCDDSQRFVVCNLSGQIGLWDTGTGSMLREFADRGPALKSLAVPPDARQFAAGEQRGGVTLWDVGSGNPLTSFHAHPQFLSEVKYSPDARRLATVGVPGAVKLWDVTRGTELFSAATSGRADSISFSPDGRQFAVGLGDSVAVYDARDWTADEKMGRFLAKRISSEFPLREQAIAEIEHQEGWSPEVSRAALAYVETATSTSTQYAARAMWLLAEAAAPNSDKLDQARRMGQTLLQSEPDNAEFRRLKAALDLTSGDPRAALDTLGEPSLIVHPIEAAIAAMAFHQAGESTARDEIAARFEIQATEAAATDSDAARAYQTWLGKPGAARFQAKDYNGAIQDFELVSKFVPLTAPHAEMLADALAYCGRWNESAQISRQALRRNESWKRTYLCGLLHLAANDMTGYREICRELTSKHADNPNAVNYIALTCSLGEGGAEDISALMKAALRQAKMRKNDPSTLTSLGCLQYRAGQLTEARDTLQKALNFHSIATLTARDRSGELRLGRLTCLTFLLQVHRDLGDADQLRKRTVAAEKLIAEIETSDPTPGLIVPWVDRFAVVIARRELARASTTPAAAAQLP